MSWYQQAWFTHGALPALLCATVAWVGLVRRFTGRGRVLGTRSSVLLAVTVVTMMSGVAVITGLLLPQIAHLPPLAVGLATGVGVAPRGRQQSDTTQPVVKFMTLGIASVLERLEYRLTTDCAAWTDSFMDGFKDCNQLQIFAHAVKLHLKSRHSDKTVLKAIEERYEEALTAIDQASNTQMMIEEARRIATPDGIAEQRRSPTDSEEAACIRALAEATERCKHLLALSYLHGRRSERAGLRNLREAAVASSSYRSNVPTQRRWFSLARRGRR